MPGHCADCHGLLNGGDGVKVVRIVHKVCASPREHEDWCNALQDYSPPSARENS
jgi:hypothetical protein